MELAGTYTYVGSRRRNQKWTGEKVDVLKALVGRRVDYDKIAAELQTTVGAVCGKVHRLGIGKGHMPQAKQPIGQAQINDDAEHKRVMAAQEIEAQLRTGVPLAELADHNCRFVLGEPREHRYCGRERRIGTPYCDDHHDRCSRPLWPNGRPGSPHARMPWASVLESPIDTRTFDLADGSHHPVQDPCRDPVPA